MNQLSIKKKNELTKKKKGFTLVELIIVIAVIAILVVMAIPKFGRTRTEAAVSNDVAAAKNIQSQIALDIANNTIPIPNSDDTTSTVVSDDILERLDGKIASTHTAQAISDAKFEYRLMANGDIEVYVDKSGTEYQLYPDNNGNGRKDYLAAAQ